MPLQVGILHIYHADNNASLANVFLSFFLLRSYIAHINQLTVMCFAIILYHNPIIYNFTSVAIDIREETYDFWFIAE